jgi:hypothetical protein
MFGIMKALQAGEELKNPATWKNRQTTVSLLLVLLGLGSNIAKSFFNIDLPDSVIADIAEMLAIILGLANAYFVNATSKKVGV